MQLMDCSLIKLSDFISWDKFSGSKSPFIIDLWNIFSQEIIKWNVRYDWQICSKLILNIDFRRINFYTFFAWAFPQWFRISKKEKPRWKKLLDFLQLSISWFFYCALWPYFVVEQGLHPPMELSFHYD